MDDQRVAIRSLHDIGRQAIPLLIGSLDEDAPFDQIQLLDPKLSNIPPDSLERTRIGVLYAYVIELILGRSSLREVDRDGFLLPDCVYTYGLLKKEGQILRQEDMSALRQIYQQWWDRHSDTPLDELRQQWTEGDRPLSGSQFRWL